MSMTLGELIEQLEDAMEAYGPDVEVRLAHQPQWAFEYGIAEVVVVDQDDVADAVEAEFLEGTGFHSADQLDDPEDRKQVEEAVEEARETFKTVVYIGEGNQIGYLPGAAKNALGWSTRRSA